MTIRQQIVTALQTRLASITAYSGRVYNWRVVPLDETDLPAIEFRDGAAQVAFDGAENGNARHTMSVDIEAFHAAGTGTATDLRTALQSLAGVVFADPHWSEITGADCYSEMTGHDITIEQQEKIIGAAKLTVNIWYETTLGEV